MAEINSISELLVFLTAAVTYYNYPNVDPNLRFPDSPPINVTSKTYDFIIVGAGSAGCVLANRLSEISDWEILLIEAGGEETVESDTPLLAELVWTTPLNYNYTTAKQKSACLSSNGVCAYPRGRVVGGTSVLNYMAYVRGNKKDYDNWAALGNHGWSYSDVLPYFKLSEDNQDATKFNSSYHSTGGYQTVSNGVYHTPLADQLIQGGIELGFPEIDVNAESQIGLTRLQLTTRNGSRCSTNKAFLRPVRNRPNLTLSKYSQVTQILFNGTRATGVKYIRDDKEYTVYATKEIIVSGGAVNSPQILMLSGIGPEEDLKKLNIPVLRNLKVGYNLQDHLGTPSAYTTTPHVAITSDDYASLDSIVKFSQPFGTGPLTVGGSLEVILFAATRFASSPDYPDIQFHITSADARFTNSDENIFVIYSLVLNPQSRGRILLQSKNPTDAPIIDPNYFSDPRDLQSSLEGVKLARSLVNTPAMQRINSTLYTDWYQYCGNRTNDFTVCTIQGYSQTFFHPVGTCKMGPHSDSTAVVGPHLRVHGVQNLRVIDASVMPKITRGNTNAPTIMIAERGADLIKIDHGKTPHIKQ